MNDQKKSIWSRLERKFYNARRYGKSFFLNSLLFYCRSSGDPAAAAATALTKSLYRARLCTKHCISVSLCEPGVNVLVVFNEQLSRFVIVQVSLQHFH